VSWHEPGLKVGEHVADAVLTKQLAVGGGVSVWAARTEGAKKTTVCGIVPGAGDAARDRFLTQAAHTAEREEPLAGVMPVLSVDPIAGAYVGDLAASATLADIATFDWELAIKVKAFQHMVEAVGRLHGEGITHGWLRPENVLFDATLCPHLANARGLDVAESCRVDPSAAQVHKPFTAPEIRHGASAEPYSDVYALGRLLQFMLKEKEPDEGDERLPSLKSLAGQDDNLVRIVRRCTTMNTTERYADAAELLADLHKRTAGEPVGLALTASPGEGRSESKAPKSQGRAAAAQREAQSLRPASRPVSRPKSRKKGKGERAKLWTPKRALIAGIVGLVMLVGSVGVAYLRGDDHIALMVLSWLSALPLGFALPSSSKNASLMRVGAAVLLLAGLVFIDPVVLGKSGHSAGLRSPDLAERVATLRSMRAGADRDFRHVDLTGADLSSVDFAGSRLDRAILRNANCRGANFSNASTWNVDVTNANFSGANLAGVAPHLWTGWEQTVCDAATKMPGAWECRDGHPALIPQK
jgi:hypothetical protein